MEPSGNALSIAKQRYMHHNENTWHDACSRVAREICRPERNGARESTREVFFNMMYQMLFIPGGRIMYGAGRTPMSMMNCNVLGVDDSRESIGDMYRDFLCVSGRGGGVGCDWSPLRPFGAPIKGELGLASGPLPFINVVDTLAETIKAGNVRRAAVMTSLGIWHPNIIDFVHAKKDLTRWRNMNISVQITDEFIEAVKNNTPWVFTFLGREYRRWVVRERDKDGNAIKDHVVSGTDHEYAIACVRGNHVASPESVLEVVSEQVVLARDLWDVIAKNAIECGEPGIINISMMKRYNNVEYCAPIVSTNPCGELPLQRDGSCVLGSVNLRAHVNNAGVQWKRMEKTVRAAVRFLDNVLDVNDYPTENIKHASLSVRRIGLGVMGLHSMLAFMGIPFGSEESVILSEDISRKIRDWAYDASVELAKEKGAFPAFDKKKYMESEFVRTLPERIKLNISNFGIRNGSLLTVAPTGTSSMVPDVTGGIAPVYAAAYQRRYMVKGRPTTKVMVSSIARDMIENGRDPTTLETSANGKISPQQYLDIQAAWQQHVDGSISQTVIIPKDADSRDYSELLLERIGGIKGVTLYKPGSRGEEPIEALDINSIKEFKKLIGKDNGDHESMMMAEGGCKDGKCDI